MFILGVTTPIPPFYHSTITPLHHYTIPPYHHTTIPSLHHTTITPLHHCTTHSQNSALKESLCPLDTSLLYKFPANPTSLPVSVNVRLLHWLSTMLMQYLPFHVYSISHLVSPECKIARGHGNSMISFWENHHALS